MFLRPKHCLENGENSISENLNFKIFWGGMPRDPPRKLAPLARSKTRLPPTFPVGTSTLKLIDSTVYNTCRQTEPVFSREMFTLVLFLLY